MVLIVQVSVLAFQGQRLAWFLLALRGGSALYLRSQLFVRLGDVKEKQKGLRLVGSVAVDSTGCWDSSRH